MACIVTLGGYYLMTSSFVTAGVIAQNMEFGFVDYQKLYKPYKTW